MLQQVIKKAKNLFSRYKQSGVFLALCALLVQNILIFSEHYLGKAFFPADFFKAYYGLVAFWTTSIREGIFPQWMPFGNMGYPFAMALQSAFYYPPFWIFTLSDSFPYSIHAAIVVQCLHILFGAVGFFLFSRLLIQSTGLALLGAIAFQFFGGFYSNAEHPDIVRAYAWLPWLFYGVYIAPGQIKLSLRNWFTPLILYCFITGAYQGNLISHLAFLFGTQLLSFGQTIRKLKSFKKQTLRAQVAVMGLCLLGVFLSAVYLFPGLLAKDFLVRASMHAGMGKMNWTPKYWPTLFMGWENDGYQTDITMISAFVTVPVMCFLGLMSFSVIKRHWVFSVALVMSFALAAGTSSFVYNGLIHLFPVFSYSRFPTSDYRGLLGFFVILFGVLFLFEFVNKKSTSQLWLRFAVIPSFFFVGFLTQLFPVGYMAKEFVMTAVLALSAISVIYTFRKKPALLLVGLVVLTGVSGLYVLERQAPATWKVLGGLNDWFQKDLRVNTQVSLPLVQRLRSPPVNRPARVEGTVPSWLGLLTGEYIFTGEYFLLNQYTRVIESQTLRAFMRDVWKPVLVPSGGGVNCNTLAQPTQPGVRVEQLSYRLNEIRYHVRASADFTMVENEIYFPGWSGRSSKDSKPVISSSLCGALRTWNLPKGEYDFTEEFKMPALFESGLISAIALLLYIALVLRRMAVI